MKVYVVRHSEAHDVGEQGIERDEDRFLTKRGQKRSRRTGKALAQLGAAPDVIWTSPLVRARQTAEHLAGELKPSPPIVNCTQLAPPGDAEKLLERLSKEALAEVVLVGHMPFVGELLLMMIAGSERLGMAVSKSSVACVELGGDPNGEARLRWLLDNAVMKALKK